MRSNWKVLEKLLGVLFVTPVVRIWGAELHERFPKFMLCQMINFK